MNMEGFIIYKECPKKWYYYHVYEKSGLATFVRYLFYAGLFIGGLALVSSEGLWFPVPNLVGMGMVAIFAILVNGEVNAR